MYFFDRTLFTRCFKLRNSVSQVRPEAFEEVACISAFCERQLPEGGEGTIAPILTQIKLPKKIKYNKEQPYFELLNINLTNSESINHQSDELQPGHENWAAEKQPR
jgi:hypothetical protein